MAITAFEVSEWLRTNKDKVCLVSLANSTRRSFLDPATKVLQLDSVIWSTQENTLMIKGVPLPSLPAEKTDDEPVLCDDGGAFQKYLQSLPGYSPAAYTCLAHRPQIGMCWVGVLSCEPEPNLETPPQTVQVAYDEGYEHRIRLTTPRSDVELKAIGVDYFHSYCAGYYQAACDIRDGKAIEAKAGRPGSRGDES